MPNIEKVIKELEWCSRDDKTRRCVFDLGEKLRADKDIAYKRLQVLEWLSEVAKEPETFTHELYSDSEISNLATDTLIWINELAEKGV